MDLNNLINQSQLQKYASALADQGLSDSSIRRKLSALTTFQKFLAKKKLVDKPVSRISSPITLASRPTTSAIESSIPASASPAPNRLKSFLFNRYFIVASVLLLLSGLGYTLYTQVFNRANKNLAYSSASSLVAPNRILSFQGRLTDSSGNPITSSTGITFKLFTLGSGGTELYNSGAGNSQTVIPDENGIFSVVIGKSHGLGIASSVFSENAEVWLEITAGGETMNPRQQIATVGYALNSETLQGLPPSASGFKNTVLVIDGSGNLNLGETSPTIYSQSGTLGIIGQAILIGATDGSGGNITINPDGAGKLKFITEGTGSTATGGLIEATNANLASGNLYSAYINNDNRGYKFLDFSNYNVGTTTLSSRFSIDAYGNLASAGTINTSIGITTPRITISVGATSGYILQTDAFGNASWVNPGSAGIGTSYDAGNGLTKVGSLFKFGGALTENTRLNIGNTEVLYVNYSTGNIGLGNTSPGVKFDVAGTIQTTTGRISLDSTNNNFTLSTSGANLTLENKQGNTTLQTYDNIIFNTIAGGSAERMRITSTGNVGIGTTAPGYKLHVNGDALISTRLGIGATHPLYAFNVGGTSMLTDIFSYGSLGLGTTAPTYKLELVGSNSIFRIGDTAGNTLVDISETSAQFNLPTTFTSTGDVNMANDLNFTNQTASTIRSNAPLYLEAGESFENNDLTLKTFGTGNVVFDSAGLTLLQAQSWTLASGTTNALNVSNGLISLDTLNSRVGIGTSSPSKKLDVAGDINLTGTIFTTGTSGSVGQVLTSTGSGLQWATNVGTTYTFTNGINLTGSNVGLGGTLTSNTIINTGANSLSFLGLGNSQSLFVGASGYVGIGTTNPTQKLEIAGGVLLSPSGGAGQYLYLYDTTNSIYGANGWLNMQSTNTFSVSTGSYLTLATTGNNALFNINFSTNNTERMRINNAGNVGIGTTNPTEKLQLGSGNLFLESGNILLATGKGLANSSNGTVLISMSNFGTVGIGTTSPNYKLDVAGDINLTGTIRATGVTGTSGQVLTSTGTGLQWVNAASVGGTYTFTNGLTNTAGTVGLGGTLTSATIINTGSNSLSFLGLGNTQALFISSTGNIGIGNTSPSYKLDVNGNVKIGTSSAGFDLQLYASGSDESVKWDAANSRLVGTDGALTKFYLQAKGSQNDGIFTSMNAAGTGKVAQFGDAAFNIGSGGLIRLYNTPTWALGVDPPTIANTEVLEISSATGSIGINPSGNATAPTNQILNINWAGSSASNLTAIKVEGSNSGGGTWSAATFGGNVGINNTTPNYDLDITGDINLTGTIFSNGTSGTNGQILTSTGTGLQWVNAASVGGTYTFTNGITNNAGTVGLGGTLNANTSISTSTFGLGIGTAGNSLYNLSVGGTTSVSNLFASGRVGIGTTSPTQKFQVAGGDIALETGGNLRVGRSDTALVNILGITNDMVTIRSAYTTAGLINLTDQNGNIKTTLDSSSGNFGIGTTAPSYKLHVSGDALITSRLGIGATDTNYTLNNNGALGTNALDINSGYGRINVSDHRKLAFGASTSSPNAASIAWGDNTGWKLNFGTDVGGTFSPKITFLDTGSIGIGTTSPTKKLDVTGDINLTGTIFTTGTSGTSGQVLTSTGTGLQWVNTAGIGGTYTFTNGLTNTAGTVGLGGTLTSNTIINTGANSLSFLGLGNTQSLFIGTSGYVGIGTTNPTGKLDIVGSLGTVSINSSANTLSFSRAGSNYINATDAVGTLQFGAQGVSSVFQLNGAAAGSFQIRSTATADSLVLRDNFVGIGTSAPSKKLDVVGDINLTGTIFSNGTSGTSGQVLTSTGTGLQWVNAGSVGGTYTFTNGLTNTAGTVGLGGTLTSNTKINTGANSLSFLGLGNSQALFIGASGYVGVGTTSPNQMLHVKTGNIYADGGNILVNQTAKITLNGTPSVYFMSGSSDVLQMFTASVERLRIDSAGLIGIGTTNPTALLDITGPTGLGGSTSLFSAIGGVGPLGGRSGGISLATGNGASAGINDEGGSGGNVTISAGNGTAGGANATNDGSGGSITLTAGTHTAFLGGGSDGDITLNSNNINLNIAAGGYVKIPNLTIGVGSTVLFINGSNQVYKGVISAGTTNTFTNGLTNTAGVVRIGGTLTQNTQIGTSSFKLSFLGLGNSQALTINSNGYIGIGITDPASPLHLVQNSTSVVPGLTLQNTTTAGGGIALDFSTFGGVGANNQTARIINKRTDSPSTGDADLQFWTYASGLGQRMVIKSTGEIGIGTTSPTKKLDVAGDINLTGTIFSNGTSGTNGQVLTSTGTGLQWVNAASVGGTYTFTNGLTNTAGVVGLGGTLTSNTIINTGSNSLSFLGLGNTQALFIGASGYVGIGTTNPSQKLDIIGNLKLSGYAQYDNWINSAGTTLISSVVSGSTRANFNSNYIEAVAGMSAGGIDANYSQANTTKFSTSAVERLRISSTGQIGIGNTNPQKALDITGDINLTGTIFANGTSGTAGQVLTSTGVGLSWVPTSAIGSTYTFTNGLTNTAGSVGLGGTLTSNTIINTGSNSISYLGLGNSQALFIGNSGYVGIGSTNPSWKLDIVQNINNSAVARVYNPNSGSVGGAAFSTQSEAGILSIASFSNNYTLANFSGRGALISDPTTPVAGIDIVSSSGTGDLRLYTGGYTTGSERLRILSGGNVGIGTTNPSKKLDVTGDINLTGTIFATGVSGSSGQILSSTGTGLQWISGAGSTYTFTNGLTNTAGTVRIGGTLTQNTQIGTSSFSFSILGAGGTNAMYIGPTGNIGIGTTAQTYMLDVDGGTTNARRPLRLVSQGMNILTIDEFGLFNYAPSSGTANHVNFGGGAATTNSASGSFFVIQPGSGTQGNLLNVMNNTASKFVVTAGGYVGIGKTNPAYSLDIGGSGNLNLTGTIFSNGTSGTNGQVLTSTGTGLQWINSANVGGTYTFTNALTNNAGVVGLGGTLTSNTQIGTSSFHIDFIGLGGTQSLHIDESGRIGIGTTGSSRNLHIRGLTSSSDGSLLIEGGSSTSNSILEFGSSTNAELIYHGTANDLMIYTNTGVPLIFQVGNGEKARLTATGNFGINSVSPTGKFQVDIGNTQALFVGATNSFVGIGTSAPLKKLDVAGDINLTGTIFSNGTSGTSGQVLTSTGTGLAWVNNVGTTYSFTNGLNLTGSNVGLGGTLTGNTQIGTSSFKLSFIGLGGSQSLYIGPEGNVGIGLTSNSSYQFAVSSALDTYNLTTTTNNNGSARLRVTNNTSKIITLDQYGSTVAGSIYGIPNANLSLLEATGDNFVVLADVGPVAFINGSTETMRLTTGNKVGIGNSNPSKKLDVTGDINLTGTIFATGASGTNGQVLTSTGTGLQWVNAASVGGTYTFNNGITNTAGVVGLGGTLNSATIINTGNNSLSILGLGNSQALFIGASGYVGIGNTNPSKKLSVDNGNIRITGGELEVYNSGNNPRIILGDSGTTGQYGVLQWDSANDYYRIETNGSNGLKINDNYVSIGNLFPGEPLNVGIGSTYLFTIKSTGNVGIGTTAPSKKLDIAGDINLTGTIFATGASGTNGQVLTSTGTGLQWVNSTNVGGTYTFTNALTNNAGVVSLGGTLTSNTIINTGANSLSFLGLGNSQSLFIGASGYVGIGTTNPEENLVVASSLDPYFTVRATGTNNNAYIKFVSRLSGVDKNSTLFTDWNGNFVARPSGGKFSINTTSTSNTLTLGGNISIGSGYTGFSAPTDGMIVQGNVGIGTTNPSKKLDIAGDINLTGTIFASGITGSSGQILSSTGAGLQWISGAGSTYTFTNGLTNTAGTVRIGGTLTQNTQIGTSSFSFSIGQGNTQPLFISSGGLVGIGNTAPTTALHIGPGTDTPLGISYDLLTLSNNGNTGLALRDSTANLELELSTYNGVGYLGTKTNHDLTLFVNNSMGELTIASSNGFVGIGTTSPTKRLDVAGDIKLTGTIFVGAGVTGSNNQVLASNGAGGLQWITAGGVGSTYTFTNGLTNNAGVVGLGGTLTSNTQIGTSSFSLSYLGLGGSQSLFINNNGYVAIGTNNPSGPFQVNVGGTAALFVSTTGNIGIGTSNPGAKLDIAGASSNISNTSGDVTISAASSQIGFSGNSLKNISNITLTGTLFVGAGVTGSNNQVLASNGAGSLQWVNSGGVGTTYAFTNGLTNNSNTISLGGTLTSNTQIGTSSFALSFLGMGNSQALFIGTSGYVGIGTTNPGQSLDVNGISAFRNYTQYYNGSTFAGSIGYGGGVFGGYGNNDLGIRSFANLYLGSNNTGIPQITLDTSGNVGIGTTSPTKKLDVVGDIKLTGTIFVGAGVTGSSGQILASNGAGGLQWVNDAGGTGGVGSTYAFTNGLTNTAGTVGLGGTLTQNTTIGTSSFGLSLLGLGNSQALFIGASGYVGIGTTAPLAKFTINGGTTNNSALAIRNTDVWATFRNMPSTNNFAIDVLSGGSELAIGSTAYNLLLNPSGGYVGIGTTNPSYKLEITGSTNNYLSYIYNVGTSASSGGLNVRSDGLGNVFNANYAGTDLLTVSPVQTTINNPANFTSAGDISAAYDLNFTNSSSSTIRSSAPLYLTSGEVFNSSNLNLTTYNSGRLVLDTPGGVVLGQAQNWTLGNGTTSTTALNIQSGLLNFDTKDNEIGIGTTNPQAKLQINSYSGGYYLDLGNGQLDPDIITRVGESGYGFRWYYDGSGSGNTNYYRLVSENASGTPFDMLKFGHTTGGLDIYGGYTSSGVTIEQNGDLKLSGSIFVGAGVTGASGQVLSSNGAGSLAWITPSGASYTAGNGVTMVGSVIGLGGSLTSNTTIGTSSFLLNINGTITAGKFSSYTDPTNYFIDPSNSTVTNASASFHGAGSILFNTFTIGSTQVTITANSSTRLKSFANGFGIATNIGSTGVGSTINWQDSLFVDTSGEIGIGTTSPFSALEIVKLTVGSTTLAATGSTDPTTISRFHYGTVGMDFGILNGGASYIQGRDVTNFATDFNLLLNPNGGSVGIGTTSPMGLFEVKANGTGGTSSFSVAANGKVGIGTSQAALYQLDVRGTNTSGVAFFRNLATGNTVPTMIVQTASTGLGTTGGEYIQFRNSTGAKVGRIRIGTATTAVVYGTSGTNDLAEFMIATEPSNAGDLMSFSNGKFSRYTPGSTIAGIHSSYATLVGNENIADQPNAFPLAISGIVKLKVSTQNGPIHQGDALAGSNLVATASKAVRPGFIVARALEDYTNPDPNQIGTIEVIIGLNWYDPDIMLTDSGEINVNHNISDEVLSSLGYTASKNEIESAQYSLNDSLGRPVTRLAQFAQISSAKIKAGLVSTTNLIAKNIIAETTKSKEVQTAVLTPLSDISDTIVVKGKLAATDIQTTSVTTDNLTATDATISTLYAENIISKEGNFGQLMTDKIAALRQEIRNTISSIGVTEAVSTPSALVADAPNWTFNTGTSQTEIHGDVALSDNMVIGAKLSVLGDTQLGNAFVTGTFTAGEVAIKENFIETTAAMLHIQPSGLGSVHIMNDTLIIAENGEVTVNGNLAVSGNINTTSLFANLINSDEINTKKLTAESINVATASATPIIAESGFAALATTSAQVATNATAGTATLPTGKTELVIYNEKITQNSIIYLTPVGSTNNQVVYLKSKHVSPTPTPESTSSATTPSSFVIALDEPLLTDVAINWWIIN